ncbi:hypothetical protein F5880DRAFT_617808 [Lentinula raphanica]|nr:hypothetical protein F5880DRAFT_617808 [Lentinula raphanica]
MGTTKTSERDFVLRPQISGVLRGDRNPGFPLLYTTFSQCMCNLYQTFINVYTLVVELIVPILLAMRVYAMYERSRHVFWALWIAFGCLLPVVVWSVVISSLGTVLLEGLVCDRFFPEQKATFLAITWGCALAFDTLIFCLIIPLMSLMVRDGLAYYGVICFVHFANIVLCTTRSSSMSALTRDLSATMVLRLMLNLHKNASKGISQTHTSNDEYELSPHSAMMFNTNPAMRSGLGTTTQSMSDTPPMDGMITTKLKSSTARTLLMNSNAVSEANTLQYSGVQTASHSESENTEITVCSIGPTFPMTTDCPFALHSSMSSSYEPKV